MDRTDELVLALHAQRLTKRALQATGRRRALLLHLAMKLTEKVAPW